MDEKALKWVKVREIRREFDRIGYGNKLIDDRLYLPGDYSDVLETELIKARERIAELEQEVSWMAEEIEKKEGVK